MMSENWTRRKHKQNYVRIKVYFRVLRISEGNGFNYMCAHFMFSLIQFKILII